MMLINTIIYFKKIVVALSFNIKCMNYSKLIVLFSFVALSTLIACKTLQEVPSAEEIKACDEKVTFQTLQPLLEKSCTTSRCHDDSKRKMNFKIYAHLKNVGEKGDLKQSVLIEKSMPKKHKLTGEELRQFRCWIEGGMQEK